MVTGIGVVSPLGKTLDEMWQGLIAGQSGIDYIKLFDASKFATKIAGEVKGFDPVQYMDRKDARRMDRFSQLAVAASLQAVEHARLKIDDTNAYDIGVTVGSGIGGLTTLSEQFQVLSEKGPDRVSPFLIPMMISDMASGQVSMALGAKGVNFCTTSACASGSDAIGVACELIRQGHAKVMVTGGSEASITPIGIAAFHSARALSTQNGNPKLASRPFDLKRDGFIMAEGGVILILESLSYALKRGAPILAELLSYGATSDAYHITQPSESGEGAARAMEAALRNAGLEPAQIDYINAHGTSTPLNDKIETRAIKRVFGQDAYRVPISSTKSMLGHLLGAAGAIESAVCIMVIRKGIIPPTINLTHPDPDCDLDYVPNQARKAKVRTALSNSFGFGGHNSVLIFREYTGD